MRTLRAATVGGLSFVVLVLNTAFWLSLLLVVAAVRVLVPWRKVAQLCRRAAHAIATAWIGLNVLGLKAGGRMRWEIRQPAGLRPDGWYLVTSNHLSAVDIAIVQWLFNGRIPMLKFFLKRQLRWVPGLGVAWWLLDFPFMRRYSRQAIEARPELRRRDLETTRRACDRFRHLPTSVFNFLEGTRFSIEKRDRQGSPFTHLLVPRAGGVAQVLSSLGDRLHAWLDVTIVYPRGAPTFWQLISGQIPSVRIQVQAVPIDPAWLGRDYVDDPEFRGGFQAFLRDLWAAKDARIQAMLQPTWPR